MKVRLEPSGLDFETDAGTTLLKAAEAAGIELPSSCRNGTCRTCICQRLSGETRHIVEWPGLSAEEKAEGWILPCVAQALSDLTLDAPGARALFAD
jgi:ferredoxin